MQVLGNLWVGTECWLVWIWLQCKLLYVARTDYAFTVEVEGARRCFSVSKLVGERLGLGSEVCGYLVAALCRRPFIE